MQLATIYICNINNVVYANMIENVQLFFNYVRCKSDQGQGTGTTSVSKFPGKCGWIMFRIAWGEHPRWETRGNKGEVYCRPMGSASAGTALGNDVFFSASTQLTHVSNNDILLI